MIESCIHASSVDICRVHNFTPIMADMGPQLRICLHRGLLLPCKEGRQKWYQQSTATTPKSAFQDPGLVGKVDTFAGPGVPQVRQRDKLWLLQKDSAKMAMSAAASSGGRRRSWRATDAVAHQLSVRSELSMQSARGAGTNSWTETARHTWT